MGSASPDDRLQVARARAMRTEGRSVREVAIAMKVPRSTVAREFAPSRIGGLLGLPPGARDQGVERRSSR